MICKNCEKDVKIEFNIMKLICMSCNIDIGCLCSTCANTTLNIPRSFTSCENCLSSIDVI